MLGVIVVGEQRLGPGEQPERQRGSACDCPLGEAPEPGFSQPGLAAAYSSLDQVGQYVGAHVGVIVFVDVKGALQGRLVVAQPEF